MNIFTASAVGLAVYSVAVPMAVAGEPMPAAQQTALVLKYCAVCHSDAVRNGGLTLQHFDAAQAAPSLAAMLVSKLRTGAMGAAGIKPPDAATEASLKDALIAKSKGAGDWYVERTEQPATKAPVVMASLLREAVSSSRKVGGGGVPLYRLVLSCNAATHEGEMQLAWSPEPKRGTVSVSVDGNVPSVYKVDGTEKMGNDNPITTGPAAVVLSDVKMLPAKSLRIAELFPGEAVEFSFSDLPGQARRSLAGCFP
jgi:hypothetical protein